MFELHPKLAEDCFLLGQFKLGYLLMMNDYHYPWFILVPQKENIQESFQLSTEEQQQLSAEINYSSERVKHCYKAHKMNVAALGNQVPQLHIHIIGRYDFDTCWPHPVWGRAQHLPMNKAQLLERIDSLKNSFLEKPEQSFVWDEQWN